MSQNLRSAEILDKLRRHGKITVEELAEQFNVTVQTIRRDLSDLAQNGKVERVHGGAVLPSSTSNIIYSERQALNHLGKHEIAKACAARIPDNVSVFLNIGTSTEAVAYELRYHKNLLVVTNNLNIANILRQNTQCEILITGGNLRRIDGGLIGPAAIETIGKFKFDYAVIGCSAIDNDGDLLDFDIQETSVSQAIMKQSRNRFVVADHTKFLRSAPVKIASLAQMEALITDQPVSKQLYEHCAVWSTEIIVPTVHK